MFLYLISLKGKCHWMTITMSYLIVLNAQIVCWTCGRLVKIQIYAKTAICFSSFLISNDLKICNLFLILNSYNINNGM